MKLKYKLSLLVSIILLSLPFLSQAQKKVLIVFPEDDKFVIPYSFLKNQQKGTADSVPLKFLTLKYQFYNELTQQLVANNFSPLGGVNSKVNAVRKYKRKKWFSSDSITQSNLEKKNYVAAAIDETNRSYYNLYATTDSADYIIFINKVEVGANFFRKWLATKNYLLLVHFDVYTKNMKHLGGRYLHKKVRLTRSTYWSSFMKHFSVIPNELALYFINMKK